MSKSNISTNSSFSISSSKSRTSKDFLNVSLTGTYSKIDNFQEDFESQVIDRFVKGICKKQLLNARIDNVQVMLEDNGDFRYKMLYDNLGVEKEAVVKRTEKHTLELVAENTVSQATVEMFPAE